MMANRDHHHKFRRMFGFWIKRKTELDGAMTALQHVQCLVQKDLRHDERRQEVRDPALENGFCLQAKRLAGGCHPASMLPAGVLEIDASPAIFRHEVGHRHGRDEKVLSIQNNQ